MLFEYDDNLLFKTKNLCMEQHSYFPTNDLDCPAKLLNGQYLPENDQDFETFIKCLLELRT